jgi:hypothetical protein
MHLDLFVTNRDGAVTSSFWEPSKSWAPWFKIDPPPQTNIAGKTIAAEWANRDHLDLFAIGSDGSVWGIWWEAFVSGW